MDEHQFLYAYEDAGHKCELVISHTTARGVSVYLFGEEARLIYGQLLGADAATQQRVMWQQSQAEVQAYVARERASLEERLRTIAEIEPEAR